MTRIAVAFGLVALLAACGADGPPSRPDPEEPPRSGTVLSGTAGIGVGGSSSRIRTGR
jgi:hypothetical protein